MKILSETLMYSAGLPVKKSRLSVLGKFALTLMAVTVFSCGEKECAEPKPEPIGICLPPQHTPDPVSSCTPDTYVTVTNVICGVGVWGSYWFQLDNGDYLQPWLSNNTNPVQPGERYRISFAPTNRDNLYDSVITCMAVAPNSTPVRVNCMELVGTP